MSKILVLGRTMDMGGTEVAMAALLQKLVEKKEDVTLLLVEKNTFHGLRIFHPFKLHDPLFQAIVFFLHPLSVFFFHLILPL